MLNSMSPEEYRERYAAWLIDGFDDSWQQTAKMIAEITNVIKLAAAGWSSGKFDESTLSKPADHLPKYTFHKAGEKTKRKGEPLRRMSNEALEAAGRRQSGIM